MSLSLSLLSYIIYDDGTGADIGFGLGHCLPSYVDTGHLRQSNS